MSKRRKIEDAIKDAEAEEKIEETTEHEVEAKSEEKPKGGNGEEKKKTGPELMFEATGIEQISDPAMVFRMAMLNERMTGLVNLQQVKALSYDNRIKSLRDEGNNVLKEIKVRIEQCQRDITSLKQSIEDKHNIKLGDYAYDDLTGCLNKLPQEDLDKEKARHSHPHSHP